LTHCLLYILVLISTSLRLKLAKLTSATEMGRQFQEKNGFN